MSTISALADAVAEHINAGTYAQPVSAVRTYQPAFTLEELGELRVSVVPRTTTVSAASRESSTYEHVLDVGVQKKLPAEDNQAAIDELLELTEAIGDRLRHTRRRVPPRRRGRALRTSRSSPARASSSTAYSPVF